jgi:ribonuclease HI
MSVKGFIEKYFKTDQSSKVSPELVLEPMVGTMTRKQAVFFRSVEVKSPNSNVDPKTLHLFTDGACSDNGKKGAKGGFGVHVYTKSHLDRSAPLLASDPQTNNRAELRGIQAALDLIDEHAEEWNKEYSDYFVWSDSEYSIHCLTKWAKGWRANNWKKKDGGLIQNIDLIKPLFERLSRMPRVSLHHVRGHQDARRHEFPYDGNHKADLLATKSIA